jgi:hypothetical protein
MFKNLQSLLQKDQRVLTKLCSYSINIDTAKLKGGHDGNSLLYEVQEKERDKQPKAGYAQEPQTCHPGCLPCVRHKSIQNRETLNIYGGHWVLRGHAVAMTLSIFE